MKYKLINLQTKEEHLCNKVTIDGFDYYVNDANVHITHPCYFYNKPTNYLGKAIKKEGKFWVCENMEGFHLLSEADEVIATNNPSIDIPQILEEFNETLVHQIAADLGYRMLPDDLEEGIKAGYKESQETHPFSEEDMVEFADFLFTDCAENGPFGFSYKGKAYSNKELFEIWQKQQPKIVYYA